LATTIQDEEFNKEPAVAATWQARVVQRRSMDFVPGPRKWFAEVRDLDSITPAWCGGTGPLDVRVYI
jgi:hypothetical protein